MIFGPKAPGTHGTLMPIGFFLGQQMRKKIAVLRLCNFCHQMQNVGQTIYVAGPLFLRMVLAVILAVAVSSTQL